jgi:hypothetical protein
MKFVDLVGYRCGKLTVKEMVGRDAKSGQSIWKCLCDCGKETTVIYGHLKGERPTKSCGCLLATSLRSERATRHGMAFTVEWNSYYGAKKRCNPKFIKDWPDYGGRGIEFRFKSFEEFFAEVGPRPEPKFLYSLERIENDGHYEKGNVRWATKKQQARNRRCDKCGILLARIRELERRLASAEST